MVEIKIFSEDSGQGFATVRNLLSKLLKVYPPGGNVQVQLQESESQQLSKAVHGCRWKSTGLLDQRHTTSLTQAISADLAEGRIVIFHYDGDQTWRNRSSADSPRQFEKQIRCRVQQLLNNTQKSDLHQNLIELVPYYSIEAWTYQATHVAVNHTRDERERRLLGEWQSDRRLLDEVQEPKERLGFGSKNNSKLAPHIPFSEVLAAEKSLHAFIQQLRDCPALRGLIREGLIVVKSDGTK